MFLYKLRVLSLLLIISGSMLAITRVDANEEIKSCTSAFDSHDCTASSDNIISPGDEEILANDEPSFIMVQRRSNKRNNSKKRQKKKHQKIQRKKSSNKRVRKNKLARQSLDKKRKQ
ncbi:hypothetical protein BDF22DRAFT_682781 [Syncephalis plumigaleata]|nr:hypothetical protein BDF22DRAFT_682781 [Syncephalis plumigaleata]